MEDWLGGSRVRDESRQGKEVGMSAYVIASLLNINDPDGFADYAKVAGPTVEK